jgi:hypothetical protein
VRTAFSERDQVPMTGGVANVCATLARVGPQAAIACLASRGHTTQHGANVRDVAAKRLARWFCVTATTSSLCLRHWLRHRSRTCVIGSAFACIYLHRIARVVAC